MNNVAVNQNNAQNVVEQPQKYYTLTESIFAWLCVVAGYFFCRSFPVFRHTLGGFILVVASFIVTAVIMKIKGSGFGFVPIITMLSALVVSSGVVLCSNSFLQKICYGYSIAAYMYFLYAVNNDTVKRGISDMIIVDYFKALIIMPFRSFGCIFKAMFAGRGASSGKAILKILIGAAIAINPTVIVLALLSYDKDFTKLLGQIFDLNFANVFSCIVSLIFAIPIGMYIFGTFVSSSRNRCENVLKAETCKRVVGSLKIAPPLTVIASVMPLIFIYVIFFISQWKYYVSAFLGNLPDDFSYAEYAREGFFQLCTVSAINFVVILFITLFMQKKKKSHTAALRVLTVVYSLLTLILMATAVSKMIMYINYYGLTQKRVYATWFMVLLALLFIIVALRQFIPKMKAVAISVAVCVVLFCGLCLPNVDSFIAKYNVDRYIDGTLKEVDIAAMEELEDSAIPELVRLAEYLDEKNGTDIKTVDENTEYDPMYVEMRRELHRTARDYKRDDGDVFSLNIPRIRAEKALKDIDLL